MIPDFKALSFVLGGSLCPAKLMLVNCNINTAYAIKAMNGLLLECGSNLCELDLSGNNLQNGAMDLLEGLVHCHKLERINLCCNRISLHGAVTIFSSIGCNILELNSLDVTTDNDITVNQFIQHILTNLQFHYLMNHKLICYVIT